MKLRDIRIFVFIIASIVAGLPAANACMGVSRTINVNTFHAHLGTGGSGGIGLRDKEVVLTFDDGPMARSTPQVLAALQKECLKATFFVVGRMAKANPKLLQRIANAGHTIGQHTHDHANLTHTSLSSAQRNIQAGIASVRTALGPYKGRSTKLFRYPYLARSAALDVVLRRQNLLPFSATVMSQDWKPGSGSGMVNRVMSRLARTGRGVILLHDIQAKTASALPELLRRLDQGGYRVVHIRSGTSSAGVAMAGLSESRSKRRTAKKAVVSRNTRARRQVASLAKSEKSTRKRWSWFGRRDNIDKQTTGSVKRKITNKRKARVSKKTRVAAKISKRKGIFGYRNGVRSLAVRPDAKSKKRASVKKSRSKKAADKPTARKSSDTFLSRLKERRKARREAAKRSSKSSAKRSSKRTKEATTKRRRFSLRRGVLKQRKNESKAEYQARLKMRKLRMKRQKAALSTK